MRHHISLAVLTSAGCVAYFYAADRIIFTTGKFTPIFRFLLTVYDVDTAWVALGVCVFALFWRGSTPVLKVVDSLGERATAVAVTGAIVFAILAIRVYHDYPVCMDEYAAVFQARIFAAGRIFAQLPAALVDWLVVPGFNGEFIVASHQTGRAVSGYWPGFAALLAPFDLLGVPWLCNPVVSGLAIYLIYQITLEVTKDRRAAGWALLFTISSGAFVAYAISYYSMQAHLTANLLFAYLLMKPTPNRSLAAGLVGSLALVLHNPFPHALFAAPWIIALAREAQYQRSFKLVMLGYLPGLCVFAGWIMLRAHIVPNEDTVAIEGGAFSAFAWPDWAIVNVRAASVVKLCLWAAPALFLFAISGARAQRHNQHIRLLTYSALTTFVGYLFVSIDQGHGWGYRYFHSAWGVIPILAGCGMLASDIVPRLQSFAGATAILSMVIIVPLQMRQIDGFISHHLAQLPSPKRPGNNVIFIRGNGGFYLPDMVQIDPLLRQPDLQLWSRGSQLDAQLISQNWPDAVKLGERPSAEQWYLGPEDARRSIPGWEGAKHFVLTFTPVPQHE